MALEDCPSCGKVISENAKHCPKCGDPLERGWVEKAVRRRWRGRLRQLVITIIGLVVIANLWGNDDAEKSGQAVPPQGVKISERSRPEDLMKTITTVAVGSASSGQIMRADSFPNAWTLIPDQGVLKCELGPVYNGKPRPLVLFLTDGKTYALNGAAMGTGEYLNGRTLAKDGNLQTIRDLIPIGIVMCDRLEQTQCGDELEAFTYAQMAVEQRMKNPDNADVSMLHARTTMTSCGAWLVQSHVDAENGFGAEIRTYFTAKMTRRPDGQWEAQVVFKN